MKTDFRALRTITTFLGERNLNNVTTEESQIHITRKTLVHLKIETLMGELLLSLKRIAEILFLTEDFEGII